MNTSAAAALTAQLGDLIDTANYLQTLLLQLNPGLGISVDANSDPDLAAALASIYNGKTPPAISLQMYSYQLDAELGCAQVNLAAAPDSPIQASPFQIQALMTANKAFESQVAGSGVFSAQSSLLLRRLKSDVLSSTQIQSHLLAYPAASSTGTSTPSVAVIPAASIDVSPAVAAIVQDHVDQTGQIYSSMYQVLAQPDPVASDVANVVAALATVSVPDLIRMSGLLQMSQAGGLANSTKDLSVGISAFTLPQMLGQSAGMVFQLDQVMQMAGSAAGKMSNSVGKAISAVSGAAPGALVGVVRSMKQASTSQTTGPLKGMPLNNGALSGLAMSTPMPPSLSNLSLSSGMHEISSLLSFSINGASEQSALHQDSFQRLSARVRGDTGGLTQVLAVASSMASLSSLVTAFIKEQQGGSAIAGQSASSQLSTVSRILASSQTGNGTSYTVQSGVVSLTPPAVPVPTPGAAAVFAKSGIQTSLKGLSQSLS